ncbi:MAG: hypothetical protein QM731_00575 [Chitinophagaceae bacterium]
MDAAEFDKQMELLQRLKNKEVGAFEELSKEYSEDLLLLAYTILKNPEDSAKAVECLFTALWEREQFDDVTPPLHHFLYRELKKCCRLIALF